MSSPGSYPFGAPLRRVIQQDRSAKRVFVLGVYASAVHARWVGPDGKQLVRALAVASEPVIFWAGEGAAEIVESIEVPPSAGRLVPAGEQSNGPSGRALDADFLGPLGVSRQDAWLCDLVPHTCLNADQKRAIAEKYVPRLDLGLPAVNLPNVPSSFADDERREEIREELRISGAEVVVLLGDQPIRWWLSHFDPRWRSLCDFGRSADEYGRLHASNVAGKCVRVLPVAHPRQVAGLGWHSPEWRALHALWRENVAPELLGA